MYKAMYIDESNHEPDELCGYFESDQAFIDALQVIIERNANYSYAGKEMYAGHDCHIIEYKPYSHRNKVSKTRYYLIKIENGWI